MVGEVSERHNETYMASNHRRVHICSRDELAGASGSSRGITDIDRGSREETWVLALAITIGGGGGGLFKGTCHDVVLWL